VHKLNKFYMSFIRSTSHYFVILLHRIYSKILMLMMGDCSSTTMDKDSILESHGGEGTMSCAYAQAKLDRNSSWVGVVRCSVQSTFGLCLQSISLSPFL
jgi:hypothetical protein